MINAPETPSASPYAANAENEDGIQVVQLMTSVSYYLHTLDLCRALGLSLTGTEHMLQNTTVALDMTMIVATLSKADIIKRN